MSDSNSRNPDDSSHDNPCLPHGLPLAGRLRLALHILLRGQLPKPQGRQSWKDTQGELPELSPEEVLEAQSFFPLPKFFIFGHARSGTTMLVRLVRLHPQVHCNYQAHFFSRPPLLKALVADADVRAWLARASNRWNRGKDLAPVVLRAVADFILERDARQLGKTIVGDKSPNNLLNGEAVRHMHAIYPDARLIYIVRDGRDAAVSHRIQTFIDFQDQLSKEDLAIRADLIHDPQPFLNGERSLFTERGIINAAQGWKRNVEETDALGKALYADHYHCLRYEALLANPWEQMCQVWTFLGADITVPGLKEQLSIEMQKNPDAEYQQQKSQPIAEILEKRRRTPGMAGIGKTSSGALLTARDQQVFQEIAGQTLTAWGYS